MENPPDGIVEFKNPYSMRNNTLREAAGIQKGFCLSLDKSADKLSLNQHHDYFYQIQCTMYCTQRTWCDLVVKTKDIHIERIYFQAEFWLKGVKGILFYSHIARAVIAWQYVNQLITLESSGERYLSHYNSAKDIGITHIHTIYLVLYLYVAVQYIITITYVL